METREMKELLFSAVALALAFTIAMSGGIEGFGSITLLAIAVSMVTVSLGFLLHELGHRFAARRFGCYAEYRMWPQGLALALLSSLLGFVFAAPGAVMIHARADLWGRSAGISSKREGLISLSGPATNVFLALAFAAAGIALPQYSGIAGAGAFINAWLALFNMVPFPPLDGSKIFAWDRRVWIAASALVFVLWRML